MIKDVINILDMVELIGEDEVKSILSDFSCPKNQEVEDFIKRNAIDFSRKKLSVTFMAFNEDGDLAAIYALTHKALELDATHMSGREKKKLERFSNLDEENGVFTVSAFLIGQIGKNYKNAVNETVSGREIMQDVMERLTRIQHEVGGGVIYLDCDEEERLIEFYGNNDNRFRLIDEHVSKTDGKKYLRMMRFF